MIKSMEDEIYCELDLFHIRLELYKFLLSFTEFIMTAS
jgi:hypothetical protein